MDSRRCLAGVVVRAIFKVGGAGTIPSTGNCDACSTRLICAAIASWPSPCPSATAQSVGDQLPSNSATPSR
jgi:hypothetical protein